MSLTSINVNNTLVTRVDSEPTAGSENLVKSGGVANKLAELEKQNLILNGYIYPNEIAQAVQLVSVGADPNTDYKTLKYRVSQNTVVDIYVKSDNTIKYQFQNNATIQWSKNDYVVGNKGVDNKFGSISVPSGATYLMICVSADDTESGLYENVKLVKDSVKAIERDISELSNEVKGLNENVNGNKPLLWIFPETPFYSGQRVSSLYNPIGEGLSKGKYTLKLNTTSVGDPSSIMFETVEGESVVISYRNHTSWNNKEIELIIDDDIEQDENTLPLKIKSSKVKELSIYSAPARTDGMFSIEIKSVKKFGLLERVDNLEKTSDVLNLNMPFVNEGVERIADFIKSKSHHDISVIGFNTDQHFDIDEPSDDVRMERGLYALKELTKRVPFDVVCLGGDDVAQGGSNDTYYGVSNAVVKVKKIVSDCNCPVIHISGNHDAYQNVQGSFNINVTLKQKDNSRQFNVVYFDKNSTNICIDNEMSKIRYIFLDGYDGSGMSTENVYNILDNVLTDNLIDNGWKVVIMSHNVLKSGLINNNSNPMDVDVYNRHLYPFLDKGGEVIVAINGHCHKDVQDVYNDIIFVSTQTAWLKATLKSFDGSYGTPIIGTEAETAFDVYVIDRTDNKMFVLRYGYGNDRVFNIEKNNKSILFSPISGTVTRESGLDGLKVIAKHHFCEYETTLSRNGEYAFPYICPEADWEISVIDGNDIIYTTKIVTGYSAIQHDILL